MFKTKHCSTVSNINTVNQIYKYLSYKKNEDKTISHPSFRLIFYSIFPYCLCNDSICIGKNKQTKSFKKKHLLKNPQIKFNYLRN